MVPRLRQSRLKLVVGMVLLYLLEALLKVYVKELPFTELIAAQGVLVGAYVGAKTANNIKEKKYEESD